MDGKVLKLTSLRRYHEQFDYFLVVNLRILVTSFKSGTIFKLSQLEIRARLFKASLA